MVSSVHPYILPSVRPSVRPSTTGISRERFIQFSRNLKRNFFENFWSLVIGVKRSKVMKLDHIKACHKSLLLVYQKLIFGPVRASVRPSVCTFVPDGHSWRMLHSIFPKLGMKSECRKT